MSQQKYKFGSYTPGQGDYINDRQPIKVTPKFAVTSTEESGRVQTGKMYNTTMFTVESYDIEFGKMTGSALSNLLRAIMGKPSFQFYHFNVFNNQWQTSPFYVANIDCTDLYVKDGKETIDKLSFQVTGINPV